MLKSTHQSAVRDAEGSEHMNMLQSLQNYIIHPQNSEVTFPFYVLKDMKIQLDSCCLCASYFMFTISDISLCDSYGIGVFKDWNS